MQELADFQHTNQNAIFVIALMPIKCIDLEYKENNFFEAMKSLLSKKNKNLLKSSWYYL